MHYLIDFPAYRISLSKVKFNVTFFKISIQEKTITRPPIDFDNPSRLTTYDYRILMGLSLKQFDDLCGSIPNFSLHNTINRSSRMTIGTLLMKLRFGLRHESLAVLLGLYDCKTVSNVLQSARVALMKDFLPQRLGFEHISRRTLIDQRTRPLAKILLADNDNDKELVDVQKVQQHQKSLSKSLILFVKIQV